MSAQSPSLTLGPSTCCRLTSSPKTTPSRDAPSTPDSTSAVPGTCEMRRSRSFVYATRFRRTACRCIGGDLVLPFGRAPTAASASLTSRPKHPRRSACAQAASMARGAARASLCACSSTDSPAGHVPMNSCSHSLASSRKLLHQRSKAAHPRGEASHDILNPRPPTVGPASNSRSSDDATLGHSGRPNSWYRSTTNVASSASSLISRLTGTGVSYCSSGTTPSRQNTCVATTLRCLIAKE